MSLPLIISGHGFCGHPWLSRSEGGSFSLATNNRGRFSGLDTSTRILEAIYTVLRPIRHNSGVSLPLIISGHGFCGFHGSLDQGRSFLFGYQGSTYTNTRILGAIYTVPRPIRHNSGVSLPLIISGHGFCGHPWLWAARKELTLVLGSWESWELYILRPIRHNSGVSLPLIISGHGFCGHPWLSRSEGGPFSLATR